MSEQSTQATGRLPDFIIIGAMKSGTTSLFQLLERHPKLFMCTPKEPQYFSRDPVYARGEAWYRSLYAGAREDQLCGEASTCYTRWPHFGDAAGRIVQAVPDVRMIYLMRHPVDRSYSHYGHLVQESRMKRRGPVGTLEEALEEIGEIIDASLYLFQMEQYLKHFSREQFLLLTLDDMKKDPAATLEQVQTFLGLEPMDLLAAGKVKANKWGELQARDRLLRMTNRIRHAPVVSQVASALPKSWRRKTRSAMTASPAAVSLMRLTLRKQKRELEGLTPEMRQRLLERFAEPTRQLEDFLGRKLPAWFA